MKPEQLDALKQKRDQLNARIAKASARAQAQQRKNDTRRKIIAGAILLEALNSDQQGEKATAIVEWWEEKRREIKRPQDRALFEPRPNSANSV